MSPYQNCIRDIDKRIEEVRNQLATETDVTKRDELELENKKCFIFNPLQASNKQVVA